MQWRIDNTSLTPFRPFLADQGARRAKQLAGGMLVRGFDPMGGIRAVPSRFGLLRQYLARSNTLARKPVPLLEDVLLGLKHMVNEYDKVDFAVAPEVAANVEVRLMWKGYAANSIQMKGDFTAWRAITLYPDQKIGKCFTIQSLTPGRYFYLYIIDGVEKVDPEASVLPHPTTGQLCSCILVLNPPATHDNREAALTVAAGGSATDHLVELNLRNVALFDGGAWALSGIFRRTLPIRSLDLSYNGISDAGVQVLCGVLHNLPLLESLKLNGNGFGVDGARYLATSLKGSRCIKLLAVGGNRLGDDGAEAISGLIEYGTAIQEVCLDECYVGDGGMASIASALGQNRTVTTLSLAGNLFTEEGLKVLCLVMAVQGSVRDLRLQHNVVGPTGGVHLGEMLAINASLTALDISDIGLVKGNISNGLQAVRYGLSKNKLLQTLKLSKNNITDINVEELLVSFKANKGLVELDLTMNHLSPHWFLSSDAIERIADREERPKETTLEQYLERNRRSRADPRLSVLFAEPTRLIDDTYEGEWTNRGRWKRINHREEIRRAVAEQGEEERGRMREEEDYVAEELAHHIALVDTFIEGPYGKRYLLTIAKLVAQHLKSLSRVIVEVEASTGSRVLMTTETGVGTETEAAAGNRPILNEQQQQISQTNNGVESPLIKDKDGKVRHHHRRKHRDNQEDDLEAMDGENATDDLLSRDGNKNGDPSGNRLGQAATAVDKPPVYQRRGADSDVIKLRVKKYLGLFSAAVEGEAAELFTAAHVSLVSVLFKQLGASADRMTIAPEQVQELFQMLALPVTGKALAQRIVDETVIKGKGAVGFRRLQRYSLLHAREIARGGRLARSRLLTDLALRPPVEEAKAIVLDNVAHAMRLTIRKHYRALPGRAPKYLCKLCGCRFPVEEAYLRHTQKGAAASQHRIQALSRRIFDAQALFLRHAKFVLSGRHFPAYYSLIPELKMPKDFYPQVLNDYRALRSFYVTRF
jgi:hypothetical protein